MGAVAFEDLVKDNRATCASPPPQAGEGKMLHGIAFIGAVRFAGMP